MTVLWDQIDAETSKQIFVHRTVCYKHCAQFTMFLGGGGLLTVHHLGELEGGMNVATPRNKSFSEPTSTSDPANDYTGCIHIMFRNVRKCEQLHNHQIFLCIILKESTNSPRQQIIQVVWVFQLIKGRVTYHGKLRTRWPVIPTWKEGRFLGFVSIRERLICMLTLMKFTMILLVSSSAQRSKHLNSETKRTEWTLHIGLPTLAG
jgi:hypothetical protein